MEQVRFKSGMEERGSDGKRLESRGCRGSKGPRPH